MKIIFLALSVMLSAGLAAQKQDKDPEISAYVKLVSKDSLKANVEKLVSFGTRHTMSSTTDDRKGIGAARNWVLSKFRNYAQNAGGRMEVFLQNEDLEPDGKRINKATNLGNAIAILKGTDPTDKRIIIISGHLDSRVSDVLNATDFAPGANDDASGVAAVIEAARVLSKSKFPISILFVAVSGEEQGLLGAKMLADKAKEDQWIIEAVLNNDMIGNNGFDAPKNEKIPKLRVFSEGLSAFDTEINAAKIRNLGLENDGNARQLARYVKEIGEKYVKNIEIKLIYRNDRFLRGGDHTPFVNHGFTAIRLTDYYENYDHQHQNVRKENNIQYGDLPEFMDFEYMRKVTCSNLATFSNLAWSPKAPENVGIEVKELTNSSVLVWQAPQGKPVFGYTILIRETSASHWQKAVFTKENKIEIPYSKDNYFFAVQSVDALGHASLPVFPIPIR